MIMQRYGDIDFIFSHEGKLFKHTIEGFFNELHEEYLQDKYKVYAQEFYNNLSPKDRKNKNKKPMEYKKWKELNKD